GDRPTTQEAPEEFVFAFSEDLEAILERDQRQVEAFVANPGFVEAVRAANAANASLTEGEIARLDEEWAGPSGEALVNSELNNELAQQLVLFQEQNPRYSEIFVTDRR